MLIEEARFNGAYYVNNDTRNNRAGRKQQATNQFEIRTFKSFELDLNYLVKAEVAESNLGGIAFKAAMILRVMLVLGLGFDFQVGDYQKCNADQQQGGKLEFLLAYKLN